jgi:hypothetical protein
MMVPAVLVRPEDRVDLEDRVGPEVLVARQALVVLEGPFVLEVPVVRGFGPGSLCPQAARPIAIKMMTCWHTCMGAPSSAPRN